MESTTNRKIRYAVVGIGSIAQEAVLPAFKNAQNSELTALVSGDPTKREELGKKYRIPHTYTYEQYEGCLSSGEVDAVYIALPNHLQHRVALLLHQRTRVGLDVQAQQRLGVRGPHAEPPVRIRDRDAVHLVDVSIEAGIGWAGVRVSGLPQSEAGR